jgi:hypothetical protein
MLSMLCDHRFIRMLVNDSSFWQLQERIDSVLFYSRLLSVLSTSVVWATSPQSLLADLDDINRALVSRSGERLASHIRTGVLRELPFQRVYVVVNFPSCTSPQTLMRDFKVRGGALFHWNSHEDVRRML